MLKHHHSGCRAINQHFDQKEARPSPSGSTCFVRYARVSTDGQSVETQVRRLRAAGARRVFREVASGAVAVA